MHLSVLNTTLAAVLSKMPPKTFQGDFLFFFGLQSFGNTVCVNLRSHKVCRHLSFLKMLCILPLEEALQKRKKQVLNHFRMFLCHRVMAYPKISKIKVHSLYSEQVFN